jgi:hypothetical protein
MVDYHFPHRLEPYEDESLSGLILRYAEFYKFPNPIRMFSRLGGPKRLLSSLGFLNPDEAEGAALMHLMNLGPIEARRMTNWHGSQRFVSVLGHTVNLDLTDCPTRRVCSACLRSKPYHRASWLLAALPACPDHGTPLLNACPSCDKTLRWQGNLVWACSNPGCCYDLRDAVVPELSEDRLVGIRGLHRLIDAPHASGLELDDAFRASLFLGCLLRGLPHRWQRLSSLLATHSEDLPDILSTGWMALDPWPTAFHNVLQDFLDGARGRPAKRGLLKAYGPLAAALNKFQESTWGKVLSDEMASFSLGREDLIDIRPHVIRRRVSAAQASSLRLSLKEAAKVIGVGDTTLLAMMEKFRVNSAPATEGAQRSLLQTDVERLARIRERLNVELTAGAAAPVLGVSSRAVADLADQGLLKQISECDRVEPIRRFLPHHLEELLAVFDRAGREAPRVDAPGSDFRVMGQRGGAKDGFGILRITQEVLAGNLRPVAIWTSGPGLQRYLFPRYIVASRRNRYAAIVARRIAPARS